MAELRVHSLIDKNTKTVNLTGDNTVLIRNHSAAEIVMEAVGVVNLDTVRIVNGSASEWGTVTADGYIRATFPNVEADTFFVTAEDEDGRYISKEVVTDMVDYINLTCNVVNMRPDASGNIVLYCYGDCFNGNFGKVTNTLTVQYRYRIAGGSWSSYNSMTVGVTGNGYTAQKSLSGLNYEATYEFEFRVADQLMTVDTALNGVTTLPVFHWGKNDVAFEVPVEFKKGIVSPLPLNNSGTFFIKNSSGVLNLVTEGILLNANAFVYNGKFVEFSESGTWQPTLTNPEGTITVSGVYWSQYGWYSKCGNVVTVGFHIKFYPDTAYNYQYIAIGGLTEKLIPAYPCAGGGLCSGAFVVGGFDFQCFVAETTGRITTRVQTCNNTSSTKLETSARGCQYFSSYELTLSGTITYMTA